MLAAAGTIQTWLDENAAEWKSAFAARDISRIKELSMCDRETPKKWMLGSACMAGDAGHEVALALIEECGVDVNHQNVNGYSPLHWTCIKGDYKTTAALISNCADLNQQDLVGFSPIAWAAASGHQNIVQLLIEAGADVHSTSSCESTPLCWASACGHEEIVLMLLEAGADINHINSKDETPVMLSYTHGHEELAERLVFLGADLNKTPILSWATMNGFAEVATRLVELGADVNKRSSCGYTPLYSACRRGCDDLVTLLLQKGAAVNARVSNDCRSALHTATVNGFLDIANALIENGADLNAISATGYAPLHFAFKKNRLDRGRIARLLAYNGADLHLKASGLHSNTPLGLAQNEEEGSELTKLSTRYFNWQRRRYAAMFLHQSGLLDGSNDQGGAVVTGFILLHRYIISFL
jgi:ankyrin repeat protein